MFHVLYRWNYNKHEYDKVVYFETYNFKAAFTDDYDEVINCPGCLKYLTVAQCYISLEYHTEHGFGYGVCPQCYKQEWERRNKYNED